MSIENELSSLENRDDSNFFLRVVKYVCPWKGDALSDIIRKVIFLASIVIFCVSLGELVEFYNGSEQELQTLSEIQEFKPNLKDDTEQQQKPPENVVVPDEMLPAWYELYSLNRDVIGWISIDTFRADPKDEKTCFINYPVLQAKDNKKYLHTDIYGNTLESGSLFADYTVPITGYHRADNITIYGHNMRSVGTMFTHLGEYKKDVDFLKDNPIINFDTIYTSGDRYIIIGCYIANPLEKQDDKKLFDYWRYSDFDDKRTFKSFYKGIMERTWYSSDIECTEDDEYITLSTCSNEVDDLRWVITARKIRDDETEKDIKKMVKSYKKRDDSEIYLPKCWRDVWGQQTMYKGWDY